MKKEDFLSTEPLEKSVIKRKTNTDDEPVNWLTIQWLRYEKDEPFAIQYKTCLQDLIPFSKINLKPNKEGRPKLLKFVKQPSLFDKLKLVNHLKKKDMLYLLYIMII